MRTKIIWLVLIDHFLYMSLSFTFQFVFCFCNIYWICIMKKYFLEWFHVCVSGLLVSSAFVTLSSHLKFSSVNVTDVTSDLFSAWFNACSGLGLVKLACGSSRHCILYSAQLYYIPVQHSVVYIFKCLTSHSISQLLYMYFPFFLFFSAVCLLQLRLSLSDFYLQTFSGLKVGLSYFDRC